MRLLRLRQKNFRNLSTPLFAPGAGLTTIVGGNAQGKTNLLEAIELVLGGELRNGTTERIAFGQSEAWLYAEVETQFGNSRLEVKLSREGREHKLNEAPASLRELSQLPGAVLLGPDDLELVLGPPEERRRFLDVLLSRFSARYRAMLGQYSRALQQRNAVLKSSFRPASRGGERERPGSIQSSIGIWNQELVKYGSEILSLRRRMLAKLTPLAREAYRELAPGELGLELCETTDPERFLQALEDNLPDDLQRGATSVGPHRDDLTLLLSGREAARFGSRGECRSIALALRLAEHRLLWSHYEEAPLLLVDEWNTELDARRRGALLAYAQSLPQAILAGLETPGEGAVMEIEAGVWR
ncbi:DNA replication/repair protein RecF [Meiothermus hypogaeus]|uniref:DNA replication and repair protein RecF n=2 Tax=Meiothermus hypogaeus TaxID=884155 RepID=A0A511R2H2_9DEIN|nr:DNA replication and repair protein RecF [Meiothermus hypogaeus]RIH80503.1 DNA replication and repair protein RecF [Meiothermus hypogaeus]GEM83779.1 DNA replication and repair protein RecF [Meiothermus hypogaeus NBRC 106114]